jgi:hypothetical protein
LSIAAVTLWTTQLTCPLIYRGVAVESFIDLTVTIIIIAVTSHSLFFSDEMTIINSTC